MDPFLSHGWACFKALNLAGLKIASVEITSQRRLPVLEIQGRRGREENLLGGTVRGVGLAKGLAQEDLPLPVGGELLLSPQSVEIIKFGDPGSGR